MKRQRQSLKGGRVAALMAAFALAVLGLKASRAFADEPIVGFWQTTFKDASTGEVISHAWDVWHSDRTETENDTGRTLDGNVCQGVWVPLGQRTYGLTHPYFIFKDPNFGQSHPELGWTEDNEGEFADGSCVILERATVDQSGNNYSGPVLTKCVLGADPFDPTAQVIFTQSLTISVKRVSVDVSQLPSAD